MLPSKGMNLPAAHRTQLSCSTTGFTVPGAQSVALIDPTGQKVPTSHAMQSASLVIVIDTFVRLPPAHGSAAVAPTSQYAPSRQPLHAVELLAG